jgi:hypothetical protein
MYFELLRDAGANPHVAYEPSVSGMNSRQQRRIGMRGF